MSKHLKINSYFKEYEVNIFPENSPVNKGFEFSSLLLVDEMLITHLSENKMRAITVIASETNKTLSKCGDILERFKSLDLKRNETVTVIGGGVLQDVGTLSCSLYMRGVEWTYLPTTLLSMVDSCVGGKSAINHGNYKNIVGNYYPPKTINIFPKFCESLDSSKIVEGLFEAIKICFAKGDEDYRKVWAAVVLRDNELDIDYGSLIYTSLSAKKYFIEKDEFDRGPRLLLNFGHTFGHALEAASKFKIPHGIAVGLGMLMACAYSQKIGLATHESERVQKLKNDIYQLLRCVGSVEKLLRQAKKDIFLQAFESDKKHNRLNYKLILPCEEGCLKLVSVIKNEENRQILASVFSSVVDSNEIL